MKKQISETLGLGILLAISGGLMDAYSYLFRGEVFANAQTGNILLCSVHLSQGKWAAALHYACPIAAFSCGIALAAAVRHLFTQKGSWHWRQTCLLFEAVVLTCVAFIPQSANLLANSLISLACGAQVESFRKIEGCGVATTMCIGNLRSALHSVVEYGFTGTKSEQKTSFVAGVIIAAFAAGSVLGSILIPYIGSHTILTSTVLLLVCTALMTLSGKGGRA